MAASYAAIDGSQRSRVVTLTVADSATDSDIAALGDYRVVGIIFPASFESTAVTFKGGVSADALYPVYAVGGSAVSVTMAHTRFVALDPALLAGVPVIQAICGTGQTGANELKLICNAI